MKNVFCTFENKNNFVPCFQDLTTVRDFRVNVQQGDRRRAGGLIQRASSAGRRVRGPGGCGSTSGGNGKKVRAWKNLLCCGVRRDEDEDGPRTDRKERFSDKLGSNRHSSCQGDNDRSDSVSSYE